MNGKANEYALAVFGLAKEAKRASEVLSAWKAFRLSVGKDEQAFFEHPSIAKEEKRSVIRAVVQDPLVKDALCVLIDNRRFSYLLDIEREFETLMLKENQVLKLTVTSKTPLSASAVLGIKTKYEAMHHRPVVVETKLDPALIAGFKIAYDDMVEDRTIDRRLADLKQRLKGE